MSRVHAADAQFIRFFPDAADACTQPHPHTSKLSSGEDLEGFHAAEVVHQLTTTSMTRTNSKLVQTLQCSAVEPIRAVYVFSRKIPHVYTAIIQNATNFEPLKERSFVQRFEICSTLNYRRTVFCD